MTSLTGRNDLEPIIREWLDETAGSGSPGYVDDTLARVDRIEQRRDWLVRLGVVPVTLPSVPAPRLLLVAILLLALLVAAALGYGQPRTLPPPLGSGSGGLVVFDAGGDIHVAAADGTDRRALTTTTSHEFGATWSPAGDRVVYWSAPGADGRLASLWLIDADGTDPRQVSPGLVVDADPAFPAAAWAPDGRYLAFSTVSGHLWVVGVDGTDLREIGDPRLRRWDPAWSPNGDLIAFYGEGDTGVYVIKPDGTGETKVSSGSSVPVSLRLPAWSPDGRRLAFHIAAVADDGDVAVASFDGTRWAQSVVIGGPSNDAWPRFSPDGRQLLFLRSTPPNAEGTAWIASADGTATRQIANDLLGWAPLCISHDGSSVLAVGGEPGVPLGSEERPRVLVLHLGRDSPATSFDVPGRLSFAACSWQPPTP